VKRKRRKKPDGPDLFPPPPPPGHTAESWADHWPFPEDRRPWTDADWREYARATAAEDAEDGAE
jgi:hypothetical protein